MSVMPKNIVQKIEFCEAHNPTWTTNATAIGTTSTAVTDLTTKTTAARSAFLTQQTAQSAARDATNNLKMAMDAMTTACSDIIKSIKTKAATAGDSVYSLASIPAPATPSPKAPPGAPTNLVVTLTSVGALDMKWKCANPPGAQGTTYNVFRYTGGGTPSPSDFDFVGGSGVREFTDETVPSGVAMVIYKIQAIRSTTVGPWGTFNVFLGVSSGGTAIVQSVVNTSPKIAA